MTTPPVTQKTIVIGNTKSVAIALVLTFLFGPLGLLYSSVLGGVVMFVVSGIVAVFTLGVGLLVTWPICMIWAAVAANRYNARMTAQIAAL